MDEIIYINKKCKLEFTICKHNHIWVYITLTMLDEMGNIVYTADTEDLMKIFMLDTGAENTIISKSRAMDFGYSHCEIKDRVRVSVGGGILWCSKIEIPNIMLANNIVANKPVVLIPDDYSYNVNILGQDILQLFNYYMDNQSKNIYFDKEKYGV